MDFQLALPKTASSPNPAQYNLLKEDSPTLMTEWVLKGIYCPYSSFVRYKAQVVASKNIEVNLRSIVILRIGGDIVWIGDKVLKGLTGAGRSSKVALLEPGEEATFEVFSNISEQFIVPIVLPRGPSFTIQALLQPEPTYEGAGLAAEAEGTGLNGTGRLPYHVEELSGHRRL